MIGQYISSIRQLNLGGAIIKNNVSLTCITMINTYTGWFDTIEVLTYDLNEVTGGNYEYIDKSYDRVSQLFNNTWLRRYPLPHKVVFDNIF